MASRVPVEGKPPGQIERLLGFERERGIERAAEIVALLFEPPELVLADLAACVDVLGEGGIVGEVPPCESLGLARLLELPVCVLADRLEHPVARAER